MKLQSGIIFIMGLCASLVLTSCGKEASALVPDEYRSWKESTTMVMNYPIPGHGTNLRKIYANDQAFETVRQAGGVDKAHNYPEGTVFVKEVFNSPEPGPDALPTMLTVMLKAEDDPRSRGGWIWLVKAANGEETVMSGEFCFTCHANANESHPYGDRNQGQVFRDYVFFPPLE